MNNLRTVVTGVVLLAVTLLFIWLYQKSTDNQEANEMNKSQSQATMVSKGARSYAWTLETTVGRIVADRPEAARVLDLVGIDYCCGGQLPLEEAATAQKVDPAQLLAL